MKNKELRNPIIQSALVLLVCFILISFVTTSGAHGFAESIGAIFSGIFSTILYVIALLLAISLSICFLVAIFFGVVAISSVDKSKEMFGQFKDSARDIYCSCAKGMQECVTSEKQDTSTPHHIDNAYSQPSAEPSKLKAVLDAIKPEKEIKGKTLDEIKATQSSEVNAEIADQIVALGEKIDRNSADIQLCLKKLAQGESENPEHEQISPEENKELIAALQQQIDDLTDTVDQLDKGMLALSSESETQSGLAHTSEHRIFSFLDKTEDRQRLSETLDDAIRQELTHAQIRDHVAQTLPEEIAKTVSEHPTLTKQYIQIRRKQI